MKDNRFLADICQFKYLDFSVPIGRCSPAPGHYVYKCIELEYGSTYNFTILHRGNPLTRNNVPFYPIKLNIIESYLDYHNYIDLTNFSFNIENIESLINNSPNFTVDRHILENILNTMIRESDYIKKAYNNIN
jgi:hypothetical protein